MYEPRLKVGDRIRIIGFPMLEKLRDGKIFKVERIYELWGSPVYALRSGRTRVNHRAVSIDRSIRGGLDLNRIEVAK